MTQPSPFGSPMPWNLVAEAYAEEIVPVFEAFARDALKLAAPPAEARVVDVACGPGTLAMVAAQQGLSVDALDFSPAMIERLEARAASQPAIRARVGDGQALPYADSEFAAGFSMFGLMFFPDRARGFAELRRVLAPGAKAVVASWEPLEAVPQLAAMFAAMRAAMVKVLGDGAPKPGAAPNPLTTVDQCRGEMSAAFADVEVHRVAHPQMHASSDAAWAHAQRAVTPLVLLQRSLGAERWAAVSEHARESLREQLGTGPIVMNLPALLAVGVAR